MLHITNGDCAVAVLSRAVSGTFLPWRDVLHEGPVRAGLSLEQLSAERARFIEEAGWGSDVLKAFQERDRTFRQAGTHDEIVLWFEHDLYDQLQLIQVLDGLADLRGPPVSLVCEAEYLGEMTPQRAAELFALRSPVLRKHLQDAQAAWRAFRSPDPRAIESVKTPSLPFLGAALRRHLEEFPWTTDGLSRLERAILSALPSGFGPLFARVEEEPKFLGDVVLRWHLERLEAEGLVGRKGDTWVTTHKQRRRLPRWLGGYEVRDESVRWDPALSRLA
ncbi:MAG TPA: DUF1835 domain-containing protein [Burkholderiales bacterium]|nr:DUF1835 domain-containing protein [Burkholderiales bacterium]